MVPVIIKDRLEAAFSRYKSLVYVVESRSAAVSQHIEGAF